MEIKHRSGDGWETLYPKTIADNVKLNNGKTVQSWVDDYEPSIRYGDGYPETEDMDVVMLGDKMFMISLTTTMKTIVGTGTPNWMRKYIYLPFENVKRYTVTVMFASSSGINNTSNFYIREKEVPRIQISTVGQYEEGTVLDIDVQIIGVLED